ncbi:HupE / UreJ protein [compost metagenome]
MFTQDVSRENWIGSFFLHSTFAVLLLLSLAGPVSAHFSSANNARVFQVEHLADGLRIYFRVPLPQLVADRVGPIGVDGLPEPAPYTIARQEDGVLRFLVDLKQFQKDPIGLGRLAEQGLMLTVEGSRRRGRVESVRLYGLNASPPFSDLTEAKASVNSRALPVETSDTYAGDAVVDVVVYYPSEKPVYEYTIGSALDPGLPDQNDTDNLILDHAPDGTVAFRQRGVMNEPVSISRSVLAAHLTFVKEGVRHILEGLDHVLFVLCLTLGAASLPSLLSRTTGFTIGHSVTLALGFFGYVPSGRWFIPAVETGIALSIIYAAIIAIAPNLKGRRGEAGLFAVTIAIGLLHGLGFSFVLDEILHADSPGIWQSLAAFNVGIEMGQLAIIFMVWPIFLLIRHKNTKAWQVSRLGIATSCVAVALFWTGERALSLVESLETRVATMIQTDPQELSRSATARSGKS